MNVNQRLKCSPIEKTWLNYPLFLEEVEKHTKEETYLSPPMWEDVCYVREALASLLLCIEQESFGALLSLKYFQVLSDERVAEMDGCDARTLRRKKKKMLEWVEQYIERVYGAKLYEKLECLGLSNDQFQTLEAFVS